MHAVRQIEELRAGDAGAERGHRAAAPAAAPAEPRGLAAPARAQFFAASQAIDARFPIPAGVGVARAPPSPRPAAGPGPTAPATADLGATMKLAIERAALLQVARPCPERGRAAHHDPDPVQRQARGRGRRARPDRDRHGPVGGRAGRGRGQPSRAPPPRPRTPCTTSCASCPTAAGSRSSSAESGAEITLRAGRSTFDLPCLPADEFPAMGDEGLGARFAHRRRRAARG